MHSFQETNAGIAMSVRPSRTPFEMLPYVYQTTTQLPIPRVTRVLCWVQSGRCLNLVIHLHIIMNVAIRLLPPIRLPGVDRDNSAFCLSWWHYDLFQILTFLFPAVDNIKMAERQACELDVNANWSFITSHSPIGWMWRRLFWQKHIK